MVDKAFRKIFAIIMSVGFFIIALLAILIVLAYGVTSSWGVFWAGFAGAGAIGIIVGLFSAARWIYNELSG